jgi:nicotinamidase-related amidase
MFRRAGQPVVWIRQEFEPDLTDAFLDMRRRGISITIAGTEGCQLLPELERREDDHVIVKKRYSAFFGTGLDDLLDRLRPATLVVAGINTHACVRTTVIDAYQRDYDIVLARDAVGSYDSAHHDSTLAYLDGRMARLLSHGELATMLAGRSAR